MFEDEDPLAELPPEINDPYQQYQQFHGSDWYDDLASVGFKEALPWFTQATNGLPPDWDQSYTASVAPAGPKPDPNADAARQMAEEARFWRLDYSQFLREQLASNAAQAEAARKEGHWQFVEDLAFRREALLKQLGENEKELRLKNKVQAQNHQAQSASATGYWTGPQGTGV